MTIADDRVAGVRCPACDVAVGLGAEVAHCAACGAAHHRACWERTDACSAYDCAPSTRPISNQDALVITMSDIACAQPLMPSSNASCMQAPGPKFRPKISRCAITAMIFAIVGIPVVGVVTGAVAIVLAALALGPIRIGARRGAWLAVFALVLGLADVVGWAAFLVNVNWDGGMGRLNMGEFRISETDLNRASPEVGAALRANVLLTKDEFGGTSLGSGVVLSIHNGSALILTNKHVAAEDGEKSDLLSESSDLAVHYVDGGQEDGRVVWLAPAGVDAALVRAPASQGAGQANTDPSAAPRIGDDVFAIGNPEGLGWTHTKGSVSQFREQDADGAMLRIIQTSAAINPGNSGGGLYDEHGRLVGINTWTAADRSSEGLSFAISFESLRDMLPAWALNGAEPFP